MDDDTLEMAQERLTLALVNELGYTMEDARAAVLQISAITLEVVDHDDQVHE